MNTFRKHPLNIAITTIALLSIINLAQAQTAIPESPFAAVPLDLQNTTTIKAGNPPKPNMMLLLDDSNSMESPIDGSKKIDILKKVLLNGMSIMPINDNETNQANGILKEFGEQFNWNIHTLNGTEGPRINNKGLVERNKAGFLSAEEVAPIIKKLGPGTGQTPTTVEYLVAVQNLMQAIDYRCQKSYMIVMSDGETNQHVGYSRAYQSDDLTRYFSLENKYWRKNNLWSKLGWSKANAGTDMWKEGNYGYGISYYSEIAYHDDFSEVLREKEEYGGGRWGYTGKKRKTDVEGKSWDDAGDDPTNPMNKQTVTTYTIGFAGVNGNKQACRYLRNAASPIDPNTSSSISDLKKEPECPASNKGRHFYTANNEAQLLEAFDKAISNAAQDQVQLGAGINTTSTSTPSTAGTKIPELAAYFSLNTQKWASALYFNAITKGKIDNSASTPALFPAEHRIIVNTGVDTYWIKDTPESFYGIKSEKELKAGLIPWLQRPNTKNDKQIEAAVKSAVPNADDRTVKSYRVRTDNATDILRQMSDVLGAPTISVGKDDAGKDKYIITAANDGLVYIFKRTADDSNPYELTLNYLPGAMQRESKDGSDTVAKALRAVAEEGYGRNVSQPHLYLNDGGIVYRTTPDTAAAGKQSFIVGAMGKGGRGVYALNIGGKDRTDPSKGVALDATTENILGSSTEKLTDVPLWETEKGESNTLGYTVGTPQIGQIATVWNGNKPNMSDDVRFYAFFGNGYPINSENNATVNQPTLDTQPTLYVYEALGQEAGMSGAKVNGDKPGTQVTKIPVSDGYIGLASPTLVDSNFDGIIDTAYAGDYAGNMYRFNLKGAPASWNAVKIYQGQEDSGEYKQPITAAPAVYRQNENEFVVIFGTGSDLYQADLDNVDQQVIIGVFDNISKNPDPSKVATYDNLAEQTITKTADGKRYLSSNPIDLKKNKGWRVMLDGNNGERVVVKPAMLLSTAFLSTRSYQVETTTTGSDTSSGTFSCKASSEKTVVTNGESWIMAVNALTGGHPTTATFSYEKAGSGAATGSGSTAGGTADNNSVLSGIKTTGLASAVVLYDAQSNTLLATTPNGDAGGSGLGQKLTGRTQELDNTCLDSDAYNALYSDSSGAHNIPLKGELCPASVTRINYREIPL